ncbi:helix-turn-helix transcriptional regulator [Paenibacillus alkalitolerans]|uniref:helix-turn-helix transcriptional regulator n=1 Tax=Paenibacillus alkalitolerans TaxID=2799335 RepID=UPI0018F2B5D7|nr:helix-turn-helix transcriptional regulator [Paenibacillus alkalitolerans]
MLDNKRIGNNILNLRKKLDLTQVELSNLLGVSHQAVSKWENGECLPDIEVLLRLAKISNTSVEELLLSKQLLNDVVTEEINHPHETNDVKWGSVLQEIRKQISFPSFNTWFKNTSAKYEDKTYIIYSPNDFSTQWLYSRYSSLIINTLEELTGDSKFKIEFRTWTQSINNSDMIPDRAKLNLKATEG